MKETLLGLLAGLALGISVTLVFQSKDTSRYQIIPIEPTPGEERVVIRGVVRAVRLDTKTGETFPLMLTADRNNGARLKTEYNLLYQTKEEWLASMNKK
jgi:hypothetical protein